MTVLAVASFLAVSCTRSGENVVPAKEYGTLDLASIAVSTEDAQTVTRAVSTDDFVLSVYDSKGVLVEKWDPYSSRPADHKLEVGEYTLEICSPSLPDAAFETPWYAATKEFEILKNETTHIGHLTCTLGNIKVTVRYSEGMKEHLQDASVTISIGEGQLVFDRNESQAGYFRTTGQTSEMEVLLTATIGGYTDTYTSSISGLKAGEWHMVRFAYEETEGSRTYYVYVGDFVIGQITPGSNWGVIN